MPYSEERTALGVKFLTAGTSACAADAITFPFDTLKVRLQIQGETSFANKVLVIPESAVVAGKLPEVQKKGIYSLLNTIIKTEGSRALYNGLAAGLQRQMCFASLRIGLYEPVKNFYTRSVYGNEDPGLNLGVRILAGLTTGSLCVLVAQPTDVVKVRYQAQACSVGVKARYSSTWQAYKQIGRENGMRGLWQGTFANVVRNSLVNCAEVVVYDVVKELLIRKASMKDSVPCHFSSACISGFVATMVASPIDVVKTRFMNAQVGIYSGALDCTIQMFKEEGIRAFYKGCVPSFVRITSWNIFMWITFEQMKRLVYEKADSSLIV